MSQVISPFVLVGKKKYVGVYYEDPDNLKGKIKSE